VHECSLHTALIDGLNRQIISLNHSNTYTSHDELNTVWLRSHDALAVILSCQQAVLHTDPLIICLSQTTFNVQVTDRSYWRLDICRHQSPQLLLKSR